MRGRVTRHAGTVEVKLLPPFEERRESGCCGMPEFWIRAVSWSRGWSRVLVVTANSPIPFNTSRLPLIPSMGAGRCWRYASRGNLSVADEEWRFQD